MLTPNMISMHQNFFTLSLFQELCITLIEKNRYQQNGEVNHGQLNQHLLFIANTGNAGKYWDLFKGGHNLSLICSNIHRWAPYPLYIEISIGGHNIPYIYISICGPHIPYMQQYPLVGTISLMHLQPYRFKQFFNISCQIPI